MRKFSEYIDAQQNYMGMQPQPQPQPMQMQTQSGLEDLRNDLQKLVIKLQKLLDNRQISIGQAKDVLTQLVTTVMDRSKITTSAGIKTVKQAVQNPGIRTNSEPMSSPPMQPMAQ